MNSNSFLSGKGVEGPESAKQVRHESNKSSQIQPF